jgi:nucleotide-binding universal stress UspA family protein/uncharacterized membrane protein
MIRLRKKRSDLDRGFFVPLFPWLSIVGILLLLFLAVYMLNYSLIAWVVTVIWVVSGLGVYRGYAAHREVEHIRKVKALERIEKKEYSILVGIANPKSLEGLTQIAFAIAKRHHGEIIFLHVIEVGEGQKLRAGLETTGRVRPILDKAEELADQSGIPNRSIIKVSHRISQGIVDTAIEEDCNFIILGREKQPRFLDRVFASLLDTVLQKAPSEAAVLHGDLLPGNIKEILIPFSADIHTRLATEIAPALKDYFNAKLRIALVVEPDASFTKRDRMINQIKKIMDENSIQAELKIVQDRDVLKAIVKLSRSADLVVMGGRTGSMVELLLARSLSQEITEQVRCPVLWMKEYEERPSFWTSLFRPSKSIGDKNG